MKPAGKEEKPAALDIRAAPASQPNPAKPATSTNKKGA